MAFQVPDAGLGRVVELGSLLRVCKWGSPARRAVCSSRENQGGLTRCRGRLDCNHSFPIDLGGGLRPVTLKQETVLSPLVPTQQALADCA